MKGTTGGPTGILVTRNEVALHRSKHPNNALLVVHGITLDKSGATASGGTVAAHTPWQIEDDRLSPICYEYRLA